MVSEFRGDLEKLVEAVMRGASEEGSRGARRQVGGVSSKK